MRRRVRGRLTYANVMATLALFVGLGGGAYAAVELSRNDVKSRHIARGAVKAQELAKGSVRSSEVARNALDGSDIELPIVVRFSSSLLNLQPQETGNVTAECEPGEVATGADWSSATDAPENAETYQLESLALQSVNPFVPADPFYGNGADSGAVPHAWLFRLKNMSSAAADYAITIVCAKTGD